MRKLYAGGRSNVLAQNGIASTSQPLSTLEAVSILKMGGNAVDAAIAASAVLAVVEPGSTGIGGDCFAIVSMHNKDPIAINGSGIAPKKMNLEFLKKNNINKIELTSPHSVTIPGSVHAWYSMHQKFGKLDFEQLFITAENYARNGFPLHEVEARTWKQNEIKLNQYQNTKKIFLPNGRPPKFSEIFKNIPLANSLKKIGKLGAKAFYEGEISKDIINTLRVLGGFHDEEDFANQKTIFSDTINSNYNNYKLHQCPLNGPGITVLIMMKLLERFNFESMDATSYNRYHIQAEITKICFELKETQFGDPKFKKIDFDDFFSDSFINKLFKKIKINNVYNSKKAYVTSHPETIYLTVVDKDLNTVSFINSICHAFGSSITSKNSGVLLQNRGVNFRLEENHPNVIDGNKRPLHTIIPGILTNNQNKPILSFGVMGGQYQPIGQAHLLQNIFDFNMSIQEAIDFPRAFALNGKLKLEKSISLQTSDKLKKIGYDIEYEQDSIGGGQAIYIDRKKGLLIAGSDSRKDGSAIGY